MHLCIMGELTNEHPEMLAIIFDNSWRTVKAPENLKGENSQQMWFTQIEI